MNMATTWKTNEKGNKFMSRLKHKYGDKIVLRTDLNDWIIKIESKLADTLGEGGKC